MPTDYTEVVADEIKAVTENAVLCDFENVGEVWIPFSQIEKLPTALAKGDKNVLLSVATWIARKENLD